jgi:transposase
LGNGSTVVDGGAQRDHQVARSILVIVWNLLADPTRRCDDIGPEFYDNRIGPERRKRNHIRQLESLGYTVTLTEVA